MLTPEGLLHSGLKNEDWAVLIYIALSHHKIVSDRELNNVFSLSKYELEECLEKLDGAHAVVKYDDGETGKKYASNVGI